MTNHWIDLKNSDCILIMGANPAENHPVSMRWVLKAREDNGAMVIHVDPRFTRTSAVADLYAPLRCGTDLAMLGGLIRYILQKRLYHEPYVAHYTNALFRIHPDFQFDTAEGVFSGYDPQHRAYDNATWQYRTADGEPEKAGDLDDPQCVFQLLKKHYARYTPDRVSSITGTSTEDLESIYAAFAATGAPDRAGTIMYAMGWTQHTVGTQNIRAMTIIQLLLGNIGRAGGGVNALRGESNVQGSTDHGLLFHTLPGYLKVPRASDSTLDAYHRRNTPEPIGPRSANWWSHYPAYSVSFLKALFGDRATPENQFGYAWLPKLDDPGGPYADCSWLNLFDRMYEGTIEGLLAWGQNPACSGANAGKVREALCRLKWLVSVNLFPNETGWFFQDEGLGKDPRDIATEVFVLPAATSVEKAGSITNSGRWVQWRYQAADPPGDALPDAQIMNRIFSELVKLYQQDEEAPMREAILALKWDYFDTAKFPDGPADAVARQINGNVLSGDKAGRQVADFTDLRADGSTSSGNWLYCGSYTARPTVESPKRETNRAKWRYRETSQRIDQTGDLGLNSDWAWCWPANRRILYNRASVDLQGRPFDVKRPVIVYKGPVENGKYVDSRSGHWQGDVADGGWPPLQHPDGTVNELGALPFIMNPEGTARLFAAGLKDGPLPEHYEPWETPLVDNPLGGRAVLNPAAVIFRGEADRPWNPETDEDRRKYPFVCTTYRVTEHWQTGVMTRHCPWLSELQPRMFVEMSLELAAELQIRPGTPVWVVGKRGRVKAIALPTGRLQPLSIEGRTVHQVGLPWCFGWKHPPAAGSNPARHAGTDSANLLTASVGDANTMIPETKAFMVNIEPS